MVFAWGRVLLQAHRLGGRPAACARTNFFATAAKKIRKVEAITSMAQQQTGAPAETMGMQNTLTPTQCTCPESAHSFAEICDTCRAEYEAWSEDMNAEARIETLFFVSAEMLEGARETWLYGAAAQTGSEQMQLMHLHVFDLRGAE